MAMVTHKRLLNDSSRPFSLCFGWKVVHTCSTILSNAMACQCKWIVYGLFFCRMSRIYAIENWVRKNERNEEFEMNHEAIWKEYFSIFLYNQIFVVARSFMMKMNRVEITFFYNKRPNSYCPSLLLFSIFFSVIRIVLKLKIYSEWNESMKQKKNRQQVHAQQ